MSEDNSGRYSDELVLSFIRHRRVPAGWGLVVAYCKKEYGYNYVGANKPITTSLSGKCQELYFRDADGEYHCLPTTKFTRRHVARPPLFAW